MKEISTTPAILRIKSDSNTMFSDTTIDTHIATSDPTMRDASDKILQTSNILKIQTEAYGANHTFQVLRSY